MGDLVGHSLHRGFDSAPFLLGQAGQAGAQASQFGQPHGFQLFAHGDDEGRNFQPAPPAQELTDGLLDDLPRPRDLRRPGLTGIGDELLEMVNVVKVHILQVIHACLPRRAARRCQSEIADDDAARAWRL